MGVAAESHREKSKLKQTQSNCPLGLFLVEEGEKNSYWNKVGIVFAHKDGNGLNVELSAALLSGCRR